MMFIMGFRPKFFWLGWLLSALAFALPMTVLTIVVGAFTFWRTVSAVFYVFTVIGFLLAGITFCFMLYSMFNKAIYGSCDVPDCLLAPLLAITTNLQVQCLRLCSRLLAPSSTLEFL